MSANSNIEWTDATYNPIIGCSPMSAGCTHCYAQRMARRLAVNPLTPDYKDVAKWDGTTKFLTNKLDQPLHWRKPRRVFVCSMSDLFHENNNYAHIMRIFAVMAKAYWHTFILLTKRAKNMRAWFEWSSKNRPAFLGFAQDFDTPTWALRGSWVASQWPLPNVHLGVSCENQEAADERIPHLLACPAAVRWISVEPMFGPVDILQELGGTIPARINWVACGSETGPRARPMDLEWARALRYQCKAVGVPFFFKKATGATPEDLLVREYPEVRR